METASQESPPRPVDGFCRAAARGQLDLALAPMTAGDPGLERFVVGPQPWLAPLRELLVTPALQPRARLLGFDATPDGALHVPTPATFAALQSRSGADQGFSIVESSSDRPFLPAREWAAHLCAGRLPIHLGAPGEQPWESDPALAARHVREALVDTCALGLTAVLLPRATLVEYGARFAAILAERSPDDELALAAVIAFYRHDLVGWCAGVWRDAASAAAVPQVVTAQHAELENRHRRRLRQLEDPKTGPPLRPFIGWALRRQGREPGDSDPTEMLHALDPNAAAARDADPAELWRRLPAQEKLSRELSQLVLGASLARIRLGLRQSAVLLLPPTVPLTALSVEFPHVVPIRAVGGRSEEDSFFLPTRDGIVPHQIVFVSHAADLPPVETIRASWLSGHSPPGFEGRNTYQVFGKLLGYPACCVTRFNEIFVEEDRRYNLDIFLRTRDTRLGPYPPLLNHFLHDRFTLVPHYPCRYDCDASAGQARELMDAIERLHPRFGQHLRRLLPGLILVFENDDYLHLDVRPRGPAASTREFHVHGVKASLLRSSGRAERFAALLRPPFDLRCADDELEIRSPAGRTLLRWEPADRLLPLWFAENDAPAPQPR